MFNLSLRLLAPVGCSAVVLGAAALQDAPAVEHAASADVLGAGEHRYRWSSDWLEDGSGALGNTHGDLIVDAAGHLYVNTDTERAVQVFGADGRRLRSFGAEFEGGLHGMCLAEADGAEVLWFAHTGRHEVVQVSLEGQLLSTLSWPEASGHYEDQAAFRPTGVAVAPGGNVYVADGYGAGWIHRYGPGGEYLDSFGGPGDGDGQFRTPHGIWIDQRGEVPVVLIADREHGKLQRFSLAGDWLGDVAVPLRRPCQVKEQGGFLVVADLAGRVSILNADNELVTHLGDNPVPELRANHGAGPDVWREGQFTAPHSAAWDAAGNLYVMDWNRFGRVSRLERVRD